MQTLMMFLIPLWIVIFILLLLSYFYRNPYRLIMVFGKKGSGKTTMITKLTYKYLKKGHPVYSTVPVPGAYLFDVDDIGKIQIPPESVIFIDEVGMIWDNRNFKNFKTEVRDYFKLQRHYRHTVYLFSQAFDIDVKLRDLTDYMYLMKSYFNCISVARKIDKSVGIVEATAQGESRLAMNLVFTPWFLPSSYIFTFMPAWHKYFDSFEAPELAQGDFVLCEYPMDFEERTLKYKVVNYVMDKIVEPIASKALKLWFRVKGNKLL